MARCANEIARTVYHQAGIGLQSIRCSLKGVKHGLIASGGDFEDHATAIASASGHITAGRGCPEKISIRVTDNIAERVAAVTSPLKCIEYCLRAARCEFEHRAEPSIAAAGTAAARSSILIILRVNYDTTFWQSPIAAACKSMQNRFAFPGLNFKYGAAPKFIPFKASGSAAANVSRSIEISRAIHGQPGHRNAAVASPNESVKDIFFVHSACRCRSDHSHSSEHNCRAE